MNLARATALTLSLLLASASAGLQHLEAQVVPGVGPQAPSGWAPPSLGIRFGYDNQQQNEVLGAQVRIPVLPGGAIEIMPSMDIAFLRGLKEYQYNFEGVYVWDGRAGGLYGGAGIGLRNSIFGSNPGRTTELGYTFVVGFRLVDLGIVVPQLEYRWIVIDEAAITYQQISFGVNLALWRPVPAR
jgi:hypothetical protein